MKGWSKGRRALCLYVHFYSALCEVVRVRDADPSGRNAATVGEGCCENILSILFPILFVAHGILRFKARYETSRIIGFKA